MADREKRGEDRNTKIWITQEWKELFRWTINFMLCGREGGGGSELLLEYGVTLTILTYINWYLTDPKKSLVFNIVKYHLAVYGFMLVKYW